MTSEQPDLLALNNGINTKVATIFNGAIQIERVLKLLDDPSNNNIIKSTEFDKLTINALFLKYHILRLLEVLINTFQ